MTSAQQRQNVLCLIEQACAAGARLSPASHQIGLSSRSVQRWQRTNAPEGDQRESGQRRYVCPPNKLREDERQAVMATLNSDAFKDLPPSQIVPRLADTGVYVASESTMYRLLRQEGQLAHRRSERAAQKRSRPRALAATGPDQVFCWDITYLPTQVRGQHFYLYLFEDLLTARRWVTDLAHWYNHEHRHSAIGFVTPAQRHAGLDRVLLEKRALVYEQARQENPQRCSGQARLWAPVDVVHLNPDTQHIKEAQHTQKTA